MAARSVLKFVSKTYSYSFATPPSFNGLSTDYPCNTRILRHSHTRSYSQPSKSKKLTQPKGKLFYTRKLSRSLQNLRDPRYRTEDIRYRPEETRYRAEDSYSRSQDTGYRFEDTRYRTENARYRIQEPGYRAEDTRSRAEDTRYKTEEARFRTEDARYRTEEKAPAAPEAEDETAKFRYNDLTAREFKEKVVVEEHNEEGNPIYEVSDGYRSEENFYEVLSYMKQAERDKVSRLFPHLQPSNVKPYGSNENLNFVQMPQKKVKVVYPIVKPVVQPEPSKIENIYVREQSGEEASSEFQEPTRYQISDRRLNLDIDRKRYSTSSLTARKFTPKITNQNQPPKLTLSSNFLRRSSSLLLKNKKKLAGQNTETSDKHRKASTRQESQEVKRKSTESFIKCDSRKGSKNEFLTVSSKSASRFYNTSANPADTDLKCEKYVTVKLSELQEECRKEKRCKPKKLSFGKLPKMLPPDCACIEEPPLKPGKPLMRLKKRPTMEPKKTCPVKCITYAPRADENLVIKPKKLRPIVPVDCPCVEPQMTDFKIKRLPKKKIPEPPKICIECVGEECCPERSDAGLKVERKALPKLEINDCPCIEPSPPEEVRLARLKPNPVKEPERVCPPPEECPPRADDDLVVKKKTLPILKAECVCVEAPPMEEVPPLPRLIPKEVFEKPKICPPVGVCDVSERADKDLKVAKKKLPVFVPINCPCVEPAGPSKLTKIKRLKMRNVPKEKERICPDEEQCPPRADDGMVIKPKKLPEIKPGDCPCVVETMKDIPPLKRLVPKPVEEPPKICPPEIECAEREVDVKAKVERKKLPVLPPGACPCIEPEPPVDIPPLRKLKKRPVKERKLICVDEEECTTPRADDNLKVKPKKLPVLEASDCPCIEQPPPDDVKPLKRLRRKPVVEPPKICPKVDDCDDIPRSDKDDWMYWKRLEVNCEPTKTTKRSFSTRMDYFSKTCKSRRFYSTSIEPRNDITRLKYDVANLHADRLAGKSYNLIIDIKPSAPLILTQTPVRPKEKPVEATLALRRSISEPVDCVTFVICKSNDLKCAKSKSGLVKDAPESSSVFSTINRFISTCSILQEKDDHLQPRKPLLKEREHFIEPFPTEDVINESRKKSRMYYRTRKDEMEKSEKQACSQEELEEMEDECEDEGKKAVLQECIEEGIKPKEEKKLTWWERIVNYFKANPNCPSPEEFKKMRLREEAEKAASKAGLCLYDPKEMLKKNEKDMPKVITAAAASAKDECKK